MCALNMMIGAEFSLALNVIAIQLGAFWIKT